MFSFVVIFFSQLSDFFVPQTVLHARRINGALALFEALASSKEAAALVGRRLTRDGVGIRDSNM